jgi:hypothetical protein
VDDRHGTGGVLDRVTADRAEKDLFDWIVAVAPDHEQGRSNGLTHECLGRRSGDRSQLDGEGGVLTDDLAGPVRKPVLGDLAVAPEMVPPASVRPADAVVTRAHTRVEGVHDDEWLAQSGCVVAREVEGLAALG